MLTMRSDVYDKTRSLRQTVVFLTDKKNEITDDMLLNLVTKYFFAYVYPESIDTIPTLADIDNLRAIYNQYAVLKDAAFMYGNDFIEHTDPIHKILYDNEYPITMLADIAATTSIVKDIIQRKLSAVLQGPKYRGLDLGTGTGTGILLLAQYIQSLRNGYTAIQNIGIEKNVYTVPRSSALIKALGAGDVVYGDTTTADVYGTLYIDGPLHYISNENIPPTNAQMNSVSDPFFPNIVAIYSYIHGHIAPQTQFFPSTLGVSVHQGPHSTYQLCTPDNKFLHKQLPIWTEKSGQHSSYPFHKMTELSLSLIRCQHVEISQVLMQTSEIGKNLVDPKNPKISPHTHRSRRH